MARIVALNRLMFRPPQRPRSVDHDDKADALDRTLLHVHVAVLRGGVGDVTDHGCGYGARRACPAAIRSCALRILLAATISIALVIFCVLWMLEILVRISLPTAIGVPSLDLSRSACS
jgi:hypothetical protein